MQSHESPASVRNGLAIGRITPASTPVERDMVTRQTVIGLLEARRFQDLLGLLRDVHRHQPYDLEIMRSIRVLEHHLTRKRVLPTAR